MINDKEKLNHTVKLDSYSHVMAGLWEIMAYANRAPQLILNSQT